MKRTLRGLNVGLDGHFGRPKSIVSLALASVAVVSVLGAGVLSTPSPASAAIGWVSPPNAAPLPLTPDPPAPNAEAGLRDVACASDGTCAALGTYLSTSSVNPGYFIDTTYPGAGGWSATEPPIPAGFPSGIANQTGEVFSAAACYNGSPGTCIVVGEAQDANGNGQGVIDTFTGGTWTSSVAALPPDAASNPDTDLEGVTCLPSGTCVVIGEYGDVSGGNAVDGLIDTFTGGTWTSTQAQAPSGDTFTGLWDVACASVGTCVVLGGHDGKEPFVDTLSGGVWTPTELPLPTAPSPLSGQLGVYSLACASDNTCAAVGIYSVSGAIGFSEALYSSYQGGPWSVGPADLHINGAPWPGTVACPSAGTCVAIGTAGIPHPVNGWFYTYTGANDTWSQTSAPVPSGGSGGFLRSISCAADGTCAAVGSYSDVSGNGYALVDTYQGGTWSAYPYPPTEPADADPLSSSAELTSVTCPSSLTGCSAVGDYNNSAGTTTFGLIDSTVSGATPTMTMAVTAFTTSNAGTYTVNVSGGSGTPSGSVVVTDDQGGECSNPITLSGGTGACSIASEGVGNGPYAVTAYYSGDSTYVPSATWITVDPEVVDGSGDATANTGTVTATVSDGSPSSTVVTAAQYATDPVATSPPGAADDYVDVALSDPTASTSVTVTLCSSTFSSGDELYWYTGTAWAPITPTTPIAGSPLCLSVTLTGSTIPTPGQLIGTIFAAGSFSPSGPGITTTALPVATTHVAYRATLHATGGDPPYTWSVISGSLPGDLTLDATTGVISGDPTTTGTSGFTVQATDSSTPTARSTTAVLSISVSTPQSLHVTTQSLPVGEARSRYLTTLSATGGNPPYLWKLAAGSGRLPKGLSLKRATGVISGRLNKHDSGTYTFTVEVLDTKVKVKHHPATRNTALASLSITIS